MRLGEMWLCLEWRSRGLTVWSRRWLTLGMLVHVVVGKSGIPHCFWRPLTACSSPGGKFRGGSGNGIREQGYQGGHPRPVREQVTRAS